MRVDKIIHHGIRTSTGGEDWPFFWGENEYVISICAAYVFISNAVDELAGSEELDLFRHYLANLSLS